MVPLFHGFCMCVFSGEMHLYIDSLFTKPFSIIYIRFYYFFAGISALYLKKLSGALHRRVA